MKRIKSFIKLNLDKILAIILVCFSLFTVVLVPFSSILFVNAEELFPDTVVDEDGNIWTCIDSATGLYQNGYLMTWNDYYKEYRQERNLAHYVDSDGDGINDLILPLSDYTNYANTTINIWLAYYGGESNPYVMYDQLYSGTYLFGNTNTGSDYVELYLMLSDSKNDAGVWGLYYKVSYSDTAAIYLLQEFPEYDAEFYSAISPLTTVTGTLNGVQSTYYAHFVGSVGLAGTSGAEQARLRFDSGILSSQYEVSQVAYGGVSVYIGELCYQYYVDGGVQNAYLDAVTLQTNSKYNEKADLFLSVFQEEAGDGLYTTAVFLSHRTLGPNGRYLITPVSNYEYFSEKLPRMQNISNIISINVASSPTEWNDGDVIITTPYFPQISFDSSTGVCRISMKKLQLYEKVSTTIVTGGDSFFGGIFSAPFEFLNQLEIIKLDSLGVNITVAQVLYSCIAIVLLVAFIKLFAGG